MRTLSTPFSLLALTLILLVSVGCDRNDAALLEARPGELLVTGGQGTAHSRVFDGRDSLTTRPNGPLATKHNFAIVTQFIAVEGGDDVGWVGITDPDNLDPSTPLLESRLGSPILAPNGERVTWGEFSGAEGAIIVKCTKKETHATVHLSGLIPKGVYSVWNAFGELGTASDYAAMDSRGKSRGNTFQASARGEGHISGFTPPGGKMGTCLLDELETSTWQVVGIYHINGAPDLSEEGTFIEQVSFELENEE